MSPEIRYLVPKNTTKKEYFLRPLAALVISGAAMMGTHKDAKALESDLHMPKVALVEQTDDLQIPESIQLHDRYGPIQSLPDIRQIELKANEEYQLGLVNAQNSTLQEQKKEFLVTAKIVPSESGTFTAQSLPSNGSVPLGKISVETDAADAWTVLADCETGDGQVGLPFYVTWNSKDYYEGGFQFLNSTWKSLKSSQGYEHAYEAPPEVQLQAAQELQVRGDWGQWPSCTARMREAGYIK